MPDFTRVIPSWQPAEAVQFAVYVLVAMVWPGQWIRRQLRWTCGSRAKRLALIGLCGIVGSAAAYWLLLALGLARHTRSIGLVHFAIAAATTFAQWRHDSRRRLRLRGVFVRLYRHTSPWEAVGYGLVVCLAIYYLLRTEPLFDFDGERLRLYGAAHSDKLTSMMPCAGLVRDVPPDNLRFAGYKFLSHYFPHLAAAAVERTIGVTYHNAYWFFLPVLGIAVNGLAVLGFARRVLKSYRAGCAALLLYGLWQVTALMKPLDVTPALVLSALSAGNRFASTQRRRWCAAVVLTAGAAACYEVFHAATLVAALGLWGACGLASDLRHRRPLRRERWLLPIGSAAACWGALQMLQLGYPPSPTKIVVNNTFGDSYRHTWLDRAEADDATGRALATLYAWNRNRPPPGNDDGAARPAWYQRVVGRVIYGLGLPLYVYARFGLWATFGAVYLRRRRKAGLHTCEALVVAAACVGFTAPFLIDVGTYGGGRWWSSPNLYRVTEFAAWLTATLGAGLLVGTMSSFYRPRCWPGLLVAVAALFSSFDEHAPAATYLDVPREQVETIAFLHDRVKYDDVILHPWFDCSIRNAADGGEAYLQKRFYMLVSELAGRRCYCEGREEYLYWNGAIPHDEIERRQYLRRTFYTSPDTKEVAAVVEAGGVGWVVVDATHPAPQPIADVWPVVFQSGDVRVLRKP